MEEIWKTIDGSNGLYQVSNLGRVRSFVKYKEGKIMKESRNNQGYVTAAVIYKGKKRTVKIHILVGNAFVPNPENKPHLDHIDTNRKNNRADNLRWVTPKENANNTKTRLHYVDRHGGKHVAQYDLNGNLIATYYGLKLASEITRFDYVQLQRNVNPNSKKYTNGSQAYGYYWRRYTGDCPAEKIDVSQYKPKLRSTYKI